MLNNFSDCGCKARLVLSSDLKELLSVKGVHFHTANPTKADFQKMNQSMKDTASASQDTKPSKIINVMMKKFSHVKNKPTKAAMKQTILREKRKVFGYFQVKIYNVKLRIIFILRL